MPRLTAREPGDACTPYGAYHGDGGYGHPELATAEKGGALFEAVVDEVVARVREVAVGQSLSQTVDARVPGAGGRGTGRPCEAFAGHRCRSHCR